MRMNIFHKVALQGLMRNRTRTFVTVLGVVLSAAMFTGIVTFGTSLMQYLVNVEIAKGGEWHVVFSGADASFVQERKKDPEAEGAFSYENLGYALLENIKEESAEKPYLFVAGFGEEALEELPIHLTSGRMPENSGEILIPSHVAIKAGVRIPVGEPLTLSLGQRKDEGVVLTQCDPYQEGEELTVSQERTCLVTGTYERPGFELHEAPGYTVITRSDKGVQPDGYTVFVRLSNPRKVKTYAAEQESGGARALNENLLRFLGVTDNRILQAFLYVVGGVLATIIMVASVFLIYNSFHISLSERVHQFGILMSVGATSRQLRGSVLFEGLCIGSMGIPFGILAGIGSIRLLLPVVSEHFGNISASAANGVSLELAVSFSALVGAAVISMITILISAWIPAKKAASIPVLECIRQTNEIRTEGKDVRVPAFVWRLYSLEGALALKNFKRNQKRYRGVILSLTFSVVLTVSGSAFNTTLKRMEKAYTAQGADGDLSFVTANMPDEEFDRLYEKLCRTEGIERSTWQADPIYSAVTEELPGDFLSLYREAMQDSGAGNTQEFPLYTQFIEDDIFYEFIESLGFSREDYEGSEGKVLICALDAVEHVTYCTGSTMDVTLRSDGGGQEKTVSATFVDSYPLDTTFEGVPDWVFVMTAPLGMRAQFEEVEPLGGEVRKGMLFWTDTPSQTLARLQDAVMEEGILADYYFYNLAFAFDLFRNADFVINVFLYVFVFMISLIAVANVFNTISTNIRLRRRELAMLRSVGMSDGSFNRMMRFECMFYGARTLLYGAPLSVILSFLIYRVLVSVEKMEGMSFTFPWGAFALSVLEVFGIVFLTMVYATGRIRKENIIDALRDEMA